MSTQVFGIEITLQDNTSPVSADSAIGLFNVNSTLSASISAGASNIPLTDGTDFSIGDQVTVSDDNYSESGVIESITPDGATITLIQSTQYSYNTIDNARVDANSRFRWLQNQIDGVSNWNASMLVAGGIDPWSREIDLSEGGNVEFPGTGGIRVHNTSKFQSTIAGKGIYLNGLECSIYEFVNTTKYRRWRAITDNPGWNAREYTIPLKGYASKHNANILTLITKGSYPQADSSLIGKAVPATFGIHRPRDDEYGNRAYAGYAKFVRTGNEVWTFEVTANRQTVNESLGLTIETTNPEAYNRKHFPVIDCHPGATLDGNGDDGKVLPVMSYLYEDVSGSVNVKVEDATNNAHLRFRAGACRIINDSGSQDNTIVSVDHSPTDYTLLVMADNVTMDDADNARVEQHPVVLYNRFDSGDRFVVDDAVLLRDDDNTEVSTIEAVDGTSLTLSTYIDNTYQEANHARLDFQSSLTPHRYTIKLAGSADDIQLRQSGVLLTSGSYQLTYFQDKFVKVIDGIGDTKYRKIEDAYMNGATPHALDLYLDSTLESPLYGKVNATGVDNTWIRIDNISQDYTADTWPCSKFIDADGNELQSGDGLELYSHDSKRTAKVTTENTDADVLEKPSQYIRLPQYAYEDYGGGLYNRVSIVAKLFKNDTDQLDSFLILPFTRAMPPDASILGDTWTSDLFNTSKGNLVLVRTGYQGIYTSTSSGGAVAGASNPDEASWKLVLFDKQSGTYDTIGNFQYNHTFVFTMAGAVELFPPKFPADFDFDAVYFGIKATFTGQYALERGFPVLYWRRFIGGTQSGGVIFDPTSSSDYTTWTHGGLVYTMDTLPDFYYLNSVDTRNKNFFFGQSGIGDGSARWLTGYESLELEGITDEEKYRSIDRFLFAFINGAHNQAPDPPYPYTEIYEAALIFRRTVNIKDAIYAPIKGRIVRSTWDDRKQYLDLLRNPGDMLESVCRLQAWAECSMLPTGGWGKQYARGARINSARGLLASDALTGASYVTVSEDVINSISRFRVNQSVVIKDNYHSEYNVITSIDTTLNRLTLENALSNDYFTLDSAAVYGEGSFTADDFVAWSRGVDCAAQFVNYDDGWTEKIKRSLCRDFMLASWTDKDGYECVARIVKGSTSPLDALTLADIVNYQDIRIIEPPVDRVYPEPYVRYAIDYATGERQQAVRITRPYEAVYSSDYVEGWGGYTAEEYWGRCKTLWEYVRISGEPPANMTDMTWAQGTFAPSIARRRMMELIDWQYNPTITFNCHYNRVRTWELAHRFTIQLPHQTNDVAYECILTSINIDPNPPHVCTLGAIIMKESIPTAYLIYDTYTQYGNNSDWVDTTTEYGNTQDKVDNT